MPADVEMVSYSPTRFMYVIYMSICARGPKLGASKSKGFSAALTQILLTLTLKSPTIPHPQQTSTVTVPKIRLPRQCAEDLSGSDAGEDSEGERELDSAIAQGGRYGGQNSCQMPSFIYLATKTNTMQLSLKVSQSRLYAIERCYLE